MHEVLLEGQQFKRGRPLKTKQFSSSNIYFPLPIFISEEVKS